MNLRPALGTGSPRRWLINGRGTNIRLHLWTTIPALRRCLARLLSELGYWVEPFASAEEFLTAAPTSKARCLVVDFNLGDVSGLELAFRLSAAGFEFPVIFMTGSADDAVRMQCMEFGCVAFCISHFPKVD